MKKTFLFIFVLLLAMLLAGCGAADTTAQSHIVAADSGNAEPPADALDAIDAGYFSRRDFDSRYSQVGTPTIVFDGSSAKASTDMVEVDGANVRIKFEGTYIISGSTEDGCIIVDADQTQKIQLVLAGANISSANSAAIYVKQADKVFITLADGSENSLSNGGVFNSPEDSKIDAAVFARDDLTINGSGKLSVSSPAGHGIASNDSLSITGGSYVIDCGGKGLSANDDVTLAAASFTITSGKDAVQAQHDTNPDKGFIYVLGGDFDIKAQGDGFSASSWIKLDGGSYSVQAADDAFIAQTDLSVNAGKFNLQFGDEALRAKGQIIIKGVNIDDYADSMKADGGVAK